MKTGQNRLEVERVLAELGIRVTKSHGKEIGAHCPLHDDRHPSFSVNSETGAWICYSRCGGGGIRELVRRVLDISNKDARKWLAERGQPSGRGGGAIKAGKGKAAKARAKVNKAEIRPCPPFDIDAWPEWIIERGFSIATLKKYQCGTSYFYDALVIPVLQSHALIYRRAPGKMPKYKYTEDFKAHNTLYGLPDVELGADGSVILVEGPLDCLWLRQHGYPNSLAIMGGGTVGLEQRRIIKEDLKPDKIILAYDNDEAGRALIQKSADALRGIDCFTINWEGFEVPEAGEEDMTFEPNDVAEVPNEYLNGLFATVVPAPAKVLKKDLKKKSETS